MYGVIYKAGNDALYESILDWCERHDVIYAEMTEWEVRRLVADLGRRVKKLVVKVD